MSQQFVAIFLSEDIALLMYTLTVLKKFEPVPLAWIVMIVFQKQYSTINDENKYKSKDHLFIYFQIMVNKRKKPTL